MLDLHKIVYWVDADRDIAEWEKLNSSTKTKEDLSKYQFTVCQSYPEAILAASTTITKSSKPIVALKVNPSDQHSISFTSHKLTDGKEIFATNILPWQVEFHKSIAKGPEKEAIRAALKEAGAAKGKYEISHLTKLNEELKGHWQKAATKVESLHTDAKNASASHEDAIKKLNEAHKLKIDQVVQDKEKGVSDVNAALKKKEAEYNSNLEAEKAARQTLIEAELLKRTKDLEQEFKRHLKGLTISTTQTLEDLKKGLTHIPAESELQPQPQIQPENKPEEKKPDSFISRNATLLINGGIVGVSGAIGVLCLYTGVSSPLAAAGVSVWCAWTGEKIAERYKQKTAPISGSTSVGQSNELNKLSNLLGQAKEPAPGTSVTTTATSSSTSTITTSTTSGQPAITHQQQIQKTKDAAPVPAPASNDPIANSTNNKPKLKPGKTLASTDS